VPPIKWILLFLEQLALDYIKPAYNILIKAGSCLGFIRGPLSLDHRKRLSDAQQSVDRTGANNPMYGKGHTEETKRSISRTLQKPTYLYNLDNTLLHTFSSRVEAAQWLEVDGKTVYNYMKSGKVFKGKYFIK
jgi:group I intron endonuclease